MPGLYRYLTDAAARWPARVAVEDSGAGRITYSELSDLSLRVADALVALGVRHGDRVGIYLPKSIAALAAIHGTMIAGAAYVPADPTAPARRNATIHLDCDVRVTIIAERFLAPYAEACETLGGMPPVLVVPDGAAAPDLEGALARFDSAGTRATRPDVDDTDLAYILYTSGSTGRPKGVMLSHRNATSFVAWCSATFQPVV
ncbi:MAG: AMP-binding protein, partial [Longimicrobiales bacterium]